MRIFSRIFLAMIGLPILLVMGLLVVGPLVFKDGVFTPSPYIRTEFAAEFSSQNFELVRVGMSKQEVERLLGKPLLYQPTAPCDRQMARYSRKKNIFFDLMSWRGYEIFYGFDGKVTGKRSSWWDDSTS